MGIKKTWLACCLLLWVLRSFSQLPASNDLYGGDTDAPMLPNAFFTSNEPVCDGEPVLFSDLSIETLPPFGYLTTWVWDFGDGTQPVTISFPNNPDISHLFPVPGIYTVTLTVTDNFGFFDSYAAPVLIRPNPIANFMFFPTCDGQPVQFMDLSVETGTGTITNWNWNFGDPASGLGNTSTVQNPDHLFTGPGTYQVSLTVTNSNGCDNVVIKPVTVSPQSNGGSVAGSTTIIFGQSTGNLSLSGNTGTVTGWQKSYNGGTFSDIPGTSGDMTYAEVPIYTGTWSYRAAVQSGACTLQYSSPATVIVNSPPGGVGRSWTGAISDDWAEPGNWIPSGSPGSGDNIVIPAGAANMPDVKSAGCVCNDITVLKGATLSTQPGVSLTVNGQLVLD